MTQVRFETQRSDVPYTPDCIAIGRHSRGHPSAPEASHRDLIESTIAQVFGIHALALHTVTRGKADVALARQVTMYLTHTVFGFTLTETGRIFERDRTTVAHACSVVEDMRDNPVFDRVIELLEGIIPAIVLPRSAH